MKDYEVLLKEMREDFRKKDVIVECIYAEDGSLCKYDCSKFGDCWVKNEFKKTKFKSLEEKI